MSRAIILHGRPGKDDEYYNGACASASNDHWLAWLQKQLLVAGHEAQTPEMFNAHEPDYAVWQREFERHVVDEPMILVGHSTGGGFFVRWLSEHPDVRVAMLVLVAPYLDPDNTIGNGFLDFTVDDSLISRVGEFHIFASSDDAKDITTSVETLHSHFPKAVLHQYDDKGHFCKSDLGTDAFPDLLNVILAPKGAV